MRLDTLEQHWNALGDDDPLWAILSTPDKRGGDWDLDEFLATGRLEIEEVHAELHDHGIDLGHERALDFGCGVGRLTQALSDHFEVCDGVDLAASMIEQAVRLNGRGERCRFHHNPAPDLHSFADQTFDFVLSLLVFQHMEPSLMQGYLREVVRVLRPTGVAYFNIPDSVRLGIELPAAAVRSRIEYAGEKLALEPTEVREVPFRVRNESELLWPAGARLLIGNHWLAPDGRVLVADDGRGALDEAVPAGGEVNVGFTVRAPDAPGHYELEVDLLQEHRGWFADLGSPTLRLPVVVAAGDRLAPPAPISSEGSILAPQIEMHVMSREETVAVIEAAGGVVLDIIARDRCGPETPSFDYIVARSPAAGGSKNLAARQPPTNRPPSLAPPSRSQPDDVWRARGLIRKRADVASFELSSRLGSLASLSVLGRGLLRRALLEVFSRQTEVNHAADTLIRELERKNGQLQAQVDAQDAVIADALQRIESLEPGGGQSEPLSG